MGMQPVPLGRKAQPCQFFYGCSSTNSKDWALSGSERNKVTHATDEGRQMRQETCDVRERSKFHIDKLREFFQAAFNYVQKLVCCMSSD